MSLLHCLSTSTTDALAQYRELTPLCQACLSKAELWKHKCCVCSPVLVRLSETPTNTPPPWGSRNSQLRGELNVGPAVPTPGGPTLPSHLQTTVGAADRSPAALSCVPVPQTLPPRQALLYHFTGGWARSASRPSVAQLHGGRWEPGAKWQQPPF